MPLLKLQTSVSVPQEKRVELVKALSKITAEGIGKPETYVMVTLDECSACMAGEVGPAAFADIRSIGGLNSSVNRKISEQVCALLEGELGIAGDRVYLNFTEISAGNWGWNSSTFG